MVCSNSNALKIAETEIKLVVLKKKLRDLRRQLKNIDPYSLEEILSRLGKTPKVYVSPDDLKEDILLIEEEISALENYKKTMLQISATQTLHPKLRKNEVVKQEFEKIRKKKGYNPGTHVEKILEEVAEKLEMTFDSVKKGFYYKPKK